jgi:hypothetical protein
LGVFQVEDDGPVVLLVVGGADAWEGERREERERV